MFAHKKGETEQFNWIFVLVAGAIFFSFFVFFTFRFAHAQEQKHNLALAKILYDGALGVAGTKNNLDTTLQFPQPVELIFTCLGTRAAFSINHEDPAEELEPSLLVFMPGHFSGTKIQTWTSSWNQPFFINNIVYFSSLEKEYYLIYDQAHASFVDELSFPSQLRVHKQARSIFIPNSSQLTVAFFTNEPPTSQELQSLPSATILFVQPEQQTFSYYSSAGKLSNTIYYYDSSFLTGALVSDVSSFSCSLQRAQQRFEKISSLYAVKAGLLDQHRMKTDCSYSTIQQTLQHAPQLLPIQKEALTTSLLAQNAQLIGNGCRGVF
ncbi:hypothetical protein HZB00_02380 [Candidatus Woesearchaeota archaeon]|nr:hypothetical protein [Candidatus Woesearchaeota archaeon]